METHNNLSKERRILQNEGNWRKHGADMFWGEIAPCEHSVQIYDDDAAFLDCLDGFVVGGLKTGDAVIVIATAAHRKFLENRLRARGVNLAANWLEGQLFSLDAEESLAKFMVDDMPDEVLFHQFVNSLLVHARRKYHRRIRAFGEMVALLWARGQNGATVRLEHLWHQFCRTSALPLFCAYPRAGFTQNADASIRTICATHSKVIAA
jgi:MEDS: MEthanogen/methylotroph, DcmR Sensory domain